MINEQIAPCPLCGHPVKEREYVAKDNKDSAMFAECVACGYGISWHLHNRIAEAEAREKALREALEIALDQMVCSSRLIAARHALEAE